MAIRINLKRAERIVLPEGVYPVRVEKVEHRPGGKTGKGTPTLHIEMITEGCEIDEQNGVKLYRDQSMQEQSLWSALEFVQACLGVDNIEGDEDGDFEFEPEDCEDTQILVLVSVDTEYDGRARNKIDACYPFDQEFEGDEEETTEESTGEEEEEVPIPA